MQRRSEVPRNCMVYGQILVFFLIVSCLRTEFVVHFILRTCLTNIYLTVLQARGDNYRENQAGISSMFLYHATILIHGETCYSNCFSVCSIFSIPEANRKY